MRKILELTRGVEVLPQMEGRGALEGARIAHQPPWGEQGAGGSWCKEFTDRLEVIASVSSEN